MNIDSINLEVISSTTVDEVSSDEKNKKQDQILIQHILLAIQANATLVQKTGREVQKASDCNVLPFNLDQPKKADNNNTFKWNSYCPGSSSSTKGCTGNYGAYGMPTSTSDYGNTPQWIIDALNKIANEKQPVSEKEHQEDEKTLINILSWQRANFMNISSCSVVLQYMNKYAGLYSNDPRDTFVKSEQFNNFAATLMEILAASIYVNNNGKVDPNEILSMASNMQRAKDIFNADKFNDPNSDAYKQYTIIQNDDPFQEMMFRYKAGGKLAKAVTDDLGTLTHMIYSALIAEITKDAKDSSIKGQGSKNIELIYIQLLDLIRGKESNAEDEIAGTANMLQELGNGESVIGNISDYFSKILNGSNLDWAKYESDIKFINAQLAAFTKAYNQIKVNAANNKYNTVEDYLKAKYNLSSSTTSAMTDAYKILSKYDDGKGNFDFTSFSKSDQNQLVSDFNLVKSDKNIGNVKELDGFPFSDLNSDINFVSHFFDNDDDGDNTAQKLAQALLQLQEMGDDLNDSIFPGLKDITDKFLGDGKGDFFKITGISKETLQKAANGDTAAEAEVFKKIALLAPHDGIDYNSSGLSTLNNEINECGSYFNDHNNAEQADAQVLSSNDEKILSFIKEMQDYPVNFEKTIVQNIGRASQ